MAALGAFLLLPRRRGWVLPLAVASVLVAGSVSASRRIALEAGAFARTVLGADHDWIDRRADGAVTYLRTPQMWTEAVWANAFWNHRSARVLNLDTESAAPLAEAAVMPLPDGRIVVRGGAQVRSEFVVASEGLELVGVRLATSREAGLVLWRVQGPTRLRH